MTFKTDNLPANRRQRAGFTLVEVLAALMFMAIVIPVAMGGLHVATRAGEMSQRKMVAARIGSKVLNEMKVTYQSQGGSIGQSGTTQDRGLTYRWSVRNQGWTEDNLAQMTMATVTVTFPVQGKNYDIQLSTLLPPQQQSSSVNTGIY